MPSYCSGHNISTTSRNTGTLIAFSAALACKHSYTTFNNIKGSQPLLYGNFMITIKKNKLQEKKVVLTVDQSDCSSF